MTGTNDEPQRPLPTPLAFSCGLLMGAADSVPGVSGGTIALIVGVYERFIDAVGDVVRAPWLLRDAEERARIGRALRLLVPLGIGVVLAYLAGMWLLVGRSDSPGLIRRPGSGPLCYAFFLGLVLFSLNEPWRRIRDRGAASYALATVACAATVWMLSLEHTTKEPEDWMLLYGGAGAIAVMLLPGVSGSLLLLILGQYTTVGSAVNDFRSALGEGRIDTEAATRLGMLAAGVVIGVATFVPILRRLLRRHHDATMAALTGLMAGSMYALWPWKSHYDLKNHDAGRMENIGIQGDWPWILVFVAAGAGAAWLLARLHARVDAASEDAAQ